MPWDVPTSLHASDTHSERACNISNLHELISLHKIAPLSPHALTSVRTLSESYVFADCFENSPASWSSSK